MRKFQWLMAAAINALFLFSVTAGELKPTALRCEYRVNPLGIDEAQPRLTWHVESAERGQRQTAYQILVASSPELLAKNSGDLWDSGKVASGETVNIIYAGRPLVSRGQYFWKVCVWDKDGQAAWIEPASWTMGLLQSNDWQADFISFHDATPVWKNTEKLFSRPRISFAKSFRRRKKFGARPFTRPRLAFTNFT